MVTIMHFINIIGCVAIIHAFRSDRMIRLLQESMIANHSVIFVVVSIKCTMVI